jgi:membrane peptidoglycan carboxypeptidase
VLGNGPVTLPGTKPIRNSHNVGEAVQIDKAMAESVNTAFATMAQELGLDAVINVAEAAGISKDKLEQAKHDHKFGLSIGSGLLTPVQQADGYGMVANGGKHYDAHVVIEMKDTKGRVLLRESIAPKDVISPDSAADATYALQQVVKYGTARGTTLPGGRPIAGKTGTNDENKDAWFVGYTPQLVAAVGMYKEVPQIDPKTHKVMKDPNGFPLPKEVSLGNIEGATTPTAIWRDFMAAAMDGKPVIQFPKPPFAGERHDLVQKPEPTPTPDPFGDGGEDPDCVPGDFTCVTTNDSGDVGFGGADEDPGFGDTGGVDDDAGGTFREDDGGGFDAGAQGTGTNGDAASLESVPSGGD